MSRGIRVRKLLVAILAVFIITLAACGNNVPKDTAGGNAHGSDVASGTDGNSKTEECKTILQSGVELSEYPVEDVNADNLYEIILPELANANYIVSVCAYYDDLLFLVEEGDFEYSIYRVDPYSVEIVASAKLSKGMYFNESVTICKDGRIVICNQQNYELYFFDDMLNEAKRVALGGINTDSVVVDGDGKYAYWLDFSDGGIYSRRLDSEETEILFDGVIDVVSEYGHVTGILGDSEWLVFFRSDNESGESVCEVRNIVTGESVYNSRRNLMSIQSMGERYLLRVMRDNLIEIVVGNGDAAPKVFTFKEYDEYENAYVSLRENHIVSASVENNEKEKFCKICLKQYTISSGIRNAETEFDLQYDMTGYYVNNVASIKNGVVLVLMGDTSRILMWDVCEESSRSDVSVNYLRDMPDSENHDEAELSRIRDMADEIEAENGVEIYFGDDIKGCPWDIYNYEVCNNTILIELAMGMLKENLEKYPDGMLEQLDNDYGSVLNIYLSGRILPVDDTAISTVVGLENTIDGNTFMVLDITSMPGYERTIHHEIFHAIEGHLLMTDSYFDYDTWYSYNPDGFSYDFDYVVNEENIDYDYTDIDTENEVYFVDIYSKSFPHEDRARIMEHAMVEDEHYSGLFENAPLRNKLGYICSQIRGGFDTEGWPQTTVWEQWVK